MQACRPAHASSGAVRCIAVLSALLLMGAGCAVARRPPETDMDLKNDEIETAIVRTDPVKAVPMTFDEMIDDLAGARIVYLGEQHRRVAHHRIQLRIIKALHERHPDLKVGMEMFSRPYQPVLDEWSAGTLTREDFLKRSHWYANWKYDYELYASILRYIRENRIPLVALNIPFHIPPKIAVGGIETLLPDDRKYLPREIETGDPDHRAYIEEIYKVHRPMLRGRDDFEDFYMAQNVWEDIMAESIARNLGDGPMVAIAGNGHIVRRFGVPARAFVRTGEPYRTVLPDPGNVPETPAVGDYIWRTFRPPE